MAASVSIPNDELEAALDLTIGELETDIKDEQMGGTTHVSSPASCQYCTCINIYCTP